MVRGRAANRSGHGHAYPDRQGRVPIVNEAATLELPAEEPVVEPDVRHTEDASKFRIVTFGMVSLVVLLAYQALAVTTAMPTVADALDGLSLYAMAFAAPMATGVIGMVVAGIWCDRWGPAGALVTGVALFIVAMLTVGLAPRMEVVVLGRAVHGLGSGLLLVSLYVVIGRAFPESLRPGVFVAMSAAWVVPSIVGPTIAGLTVEHFHWRWVFLSMPVLAIPAAFLVRPALEMLDPNDNDTSPNWDRRGAAIKIGWSVLAAIGAAVLHYGGERRDIIGFGLIGVALAGLAISSPKLLPPGIFRAARGLPTVFILRGFVGSAFFAAEIYLPLLLSRERGFSAAMAGSILTIGGVTWFAGSWIRGRLDTRVEPATFLRIGSISLCIGIANVALLLLDQIPALIGVLGWGFSGFGMGLIYASLSLLTLQLSAPSEQGKNSSALQVSEALAVAVVLALAGTLFNTLEGRSAVAAYFVCFAIAWLLAFASVLLSGRVRTAPAPS